MADIALEQSWLDQVGTEFDQPYMQQLKQFLQTERKAGKVIYPPAKQWFSALDATGFDGVKVVILGQDPYHGPGQAMGLSFSVPEGVRFPPSLRNMYKEISEDLGLPIPQSGDLTRWAKQGVLLLNATLTVEHSKAGSHQRKGWEEFTDAIIQVLNEKREKIVFLLWGSYAQKKGSFIDRNKHLVLTAPHPSPLSAHRGFFGCGHFRKTNEYLAENGLSEIDWA